MSLETESITVCDSCGIELFLDENDGSKRRKIFRSFATKNGKHYCYNCYTNFTKILEGENNE